MKMYNLRTRDQRRPPPDPRHATRRAHQQPWTGVTGAIRGSFQQPWTGIKNTIRGSRQQPQTGVRHAIRGQKADKTNRIINICTYNTRTINDLNTDTRDTMLQELENVNWDVIGFSETKEKDNKIQLLDAGHKIFFSSNGTTRSNGVGFLVNKGFASLIEDYRPLSDRLAVLEDHTDPMLLPYFQVP